MNKVYSDGSYDRRTGRGAYCIVIVALRKKDWYVEDCDTPYIEEMGLQEAIAIAGRLRRNTGKVTAVYCDNVGAIKNLSTTAKKEDVLLKHIPGHLLGKDDVVIDDDVKYHHWADTMARTRVQNRVDKPKSVA